MLKKKRLGVHIFSRGIKGGIRSIKTPIYNVTLYELLKTYSDLQMQKSFQRGLVKSSGQRLKLTDPDGMLLSNQVLVEVLLWWESLPNSVDP